MSWSEGAAALALLALLRFTFAWLAVRAAGSGDLASIAAVVLESDGSLSVIPVATVGSSSSLSGVRGFDG